VTRKVVGVFVRFRAPLAGGIDTVGGVILENIIKSTNQWVITCCGNVASQNLI
jgi:hypothetical protein